MTQIELYAKSAPTSRKSRICAYCAPPAGISAAANSPGGIAPSSPVSPLESLKIDPPRGVELDALRFEERSLQVPFAVDHGGGAGGDSPLGVDDSMPGNAGAIRSASKGVAREPRLPRAPRERGDLAVCRHSPAGDPSHGPPDGSVERRCAFAPRESSLRSSASLHRLAAPPLRPVRRLHAMLLRVRSLESKIACPIDARSTGGRGAWTHGWA